MYNFLSSRKLPFAADRDQTEIHNLENTQRTKTVSPIPTAMSITPPLSFREHCGREGFHCQKQRTEICQLDRVSYYHRKAAPMTYGCLNKTAQ